MARAAPSAVHTLHTATSASLVSCSCKSREWGHIRRPLSCQHAAITAELVLQMRSTLSTQQAAQQTGCIEHPSAARPPCLLPACHHSPLQSVSLLHRWRHSRACAPGCLPARGRSPCVRTRHAVRWRRCWSCCSCWTRASMTTWVWWRCSWNNSSRWALPAIQRHTSLRHWPLYARCAAKFLPPGSL